MKGDLWLYNSASALQDRYEKEIQSFTMESDGAASANGVSDLTERGEEPAAENSSEQVVWWKMHSCTAVLGAKGVLLRYKCVLSLVVGSSEHDRRKSDVIVYWYSEQALLTKANT